MSRLAASADRSLLLGISGFVLVLILFVSFFAPATAGVDPRPSSYNTAPAGAKAAFLLLQSLGQPVARWEQPLQDLPPEDAAHTTLILAEPLYTALEKDRLAAAVQFFLQHGGRLLTTGAAGAALLPGGTTAPSRRFGTLCYTSPEGPGPLAAAGSVEMADAAAWTAGSPAARIEQRCGPDAVVVRLPVGAGEAVWWSSASALTNAELHNDADLRLLLASLGHDRRVLFDETLQQPVRSKWSAATGLPLRSLFVQVALVFALLVFSFSRRHGPVRQPVAVPRSSPIEFAASMGHLYSRAGATGVAVAAAVRRLHAVLVREAGLSRQLAEGDPQELARALALRFADDWTPLASHLQQAAQIADTGHVPLRPRAALALVRALGEDVRRVRSAAQPVSPALSQASTAQETAVP